MKDKFVFVDSQTVTLLDGQEADIDLEYDPERDMFVVEADCERWVDNYEDFMKKYYPNEKMNQEIIDEAREDCAEITGRYDTLAGINNVLKQNCEYSSYYDFSWEYEDGSPVE